ncbi:MAG: PAS domain S-box protein [Blastocatellia bacterium]
MKFALPLRLRIPILLFIFGLVAAGASLATNLRLEHLEKERELTARLMSNGTRLVGMAQYFSGRADSEGVNLEMKLTATVPDLHLAMLCDAENRILLSTEDRWRGQLLKDSPLALALPLAAQARATMNAQVSPAADRQSIIGAFPVQPRPAMKAQPPAGIGVVVLEFDLTQSARRARSDGIREALVFSALLVLLCLALWWILHRTLTARVRRLVEATEQIAKGNLNSPAALSDSDELGDISAAIDRMTGELREHIARERANIERIQRINEALPDIIFINRDNRIRYVNQVGVRLLGATSAEQVLGKSPFDIIHSDYHQIVRGRISHLLDSSESAGVLEERIVRFDGIVRDVEVVALPFNDPEGPAIQVIMRDVTERRQAEEALRQSEEKFRLFIEHNPAAVAMFDREMRYLAVSSRWLKDYDLKGGIIGRSHYEVFPEISERWKEIHRRCLAGAIEKAEEDRFDRADGSVVWLKWEVLPWFDSTGEIGGIIIYTENITERKLAETALRESEDRLGGILNSIDEVVWSTALDGAGIYFVSPAAERLYGRPVTDFYATPQLWLEAIHPDDRERIGRAFEAEARTGRFDEEYRIIRPDGGVRWVHDRGHYVYDEQGRPLRTDGVTSDITARKQAQDALQANEARMTGIIDSAMDAIISVDEQYRIVLFNHAAEKMFGYAAQEIIGQPHSLLIPGGFRAAHDEHIRRFGETGTTTRAMGVLGTVSGQRRNGAEFPIEASISQIRVGREKLFTIILRDITQRIRDEEQLREQAALLDEAQESIVSCDPGGRILFWNRGAERLYGWSAEEVIGRNLAREVFADNPARIEEINHVLETQDYWKGEVKHGTKDGRGVIVESHFTRVRDEHGQPKGWLIINSDITEKKKLEAQFLRAQRMESIGTLAGGIAHDLNNILSPISMGVQMLQGKYHDEFSQKMLGVMAANTERGAAMVRQILSFARGTHGARVGIQPQHIVKEIVRMMRETFPKEIVIEQDWDRELWSVEGDPTQLHQVLMNLCVNARDAMPRGGKLAIRLENQTLDALSAQMLAGAAPGQYVVITVADTGEGIPPENLERIFDPFFTTKEPGRGTGLGLATVYGIVKAHGGFINVYSEPGRGTQFNIHLPAQTTARAGQAEVAALPAPTGQGELILVVDDEASIREMIRSALEAWGYRVLTAEDGVEAVRLYAQHQGEVRLVLTDMMMPMMDGPKMIRALQSLNPQVAVIGSSGLADEKKVSEARQLGVNVILTKPYNAEALLQTVAGCIRGKG